MVADVGLSRSGLEKRGRKSSQPTSPTATSTPTSLVSFAPIFCRRRSDMASDRVDTDVASKPSRISTALRWHITSTSLNSDTLQSHGHSKITDTSNGN